MFYKESFQTSKTAGKCLIQANGAFGRNNIHNKILPKSVKISFPHDSVST